MDLLTDWSEKYFSGQSAGLNLDTSGTGSVRISAQALFRSHVSFRPKISLARKYCIVPTSSPSISEDVKLHSFTQILLLRLVQSETIVLSLHHIMGNVRNQQPVLQKTSVQKSFLKIFSPPSPSNNPMDNLIHILHLICL